MCEYSGQLGRMARRNQYEIRRVLNKKSYIFNIISYIREKFTLTKSLPFGLYEYKIKVENCFYETKNLCDVLGKNTSGTCSFLLQNFPSPV